MLLKVENEVMIGGVSFFDLPFNERVGKFLDFLLQESFIVVGTFQNFH